MTDLGSLNYFLGISAQRSASGLFFSQSKFTEEILERAHMQNCNPCRTPVDTESKLGSDGKPVSDPTLYRSLAGALQYLTFTRPDISYVVQHICLYIHDPRDPYFIALKHILRYTAWLRNLLLELHAPLSTATLVYCDNVKYVASGQVRVLHVPSRFQYADIFTKGLPTALFLELRFSLNVRRPPAQTALEY
ncbi:ribonuclease H-like domain-containing protein [Tanacetum coccineum]